MSTKRSAASAAQERVSVSLRLTPRMVKQIDTIAEQEQRSRANMIEAILFRHLARQEQPAKAA